MLHRSGLVMTVVQRVKVKCGPYLIESCSSFYSHFQLLLGFYSAFKSVIIKITHHSCDPLKPQIHTWIGLLKLKMWSGLMLIFTPLFYFYLWLICWGNSFFFFRNYPLPKGAVFFPLLQRIKTLCHPMISLLPKPVNRLLSRFYSESQLIVWYPWKQLRGFLLEPWKILAHNCTIKMMKK